VNPNPPVSGEPATYTSTSVSAGQTVTRVEWDFNNDGTYEVDDTTAPFETQHTYANAGAKTIGMRVTDDAGAVSAEAQPPLTVVTRPPVAAFTFNPSSPFVGDTVLFASDSSDPDGDAISHLWDFGDGVTSPLRNPSHPFTSGGVKNVTLTVTDAFGAESSVTHQVVVRPITGPPNEPPVANFAFSPTKPKAGQQVELVSSAFDSEGKLQEQRWDLDGDGQYDDARGDDVLYTFPTAGAKTVRLRVEDEAGAAATKERTIQVGAGQKARAGFLNPFPVVRITGEVRGRGALIRLLSVRAPRGALVRVRCDGRGCPAKVRRHRVGRKHLVRFRAYERLLRAGIRLEVYVRKPGTIGKYTRFTIRGHSSPKRRDRCLLPGKPKPVRCPT